MAMSQVCASSESSGGDVGGGGGGVTWDPEALGALNALDPLVEEEEVADEMVTQLCSLVEGCPIVQVYTDAPHVCPTSPPWFCLLGSDRPGCVLIHRYASPSWPLSCFVVELVVLVTLWLLLLCRLWLL
nr:hypothetical protein [Tanacetum cinerariifolium]